MVKAAESMFDAHGYSETGRVREDNQDSIRLLEPDDPQVIRSYGSLYAVADGMGGYSHGGVASAKALEVFFATYYASGSTQPGQRLKQAIQQANVGVYQTAQRLGAVRMGTTLSAANIVGRTLHIGHIGDSRVYVIRDNKATCLTSDHTMVGELVRAHILSPDKVRTHAQRSVLNKCLGINLIVQPEVVQYALRDGDVIVLCSDGLWSVVEDNEMADLASQTDDMNALSEQLIGLALDDQHQSDDNVSALAIRVDHLLPVPEPAARRSFSLGNLFRSRSSTSA